MLFLGIDPGLARIGIGLISQNNRQLKAETYFLISTSSKLSTAQRLAQIYQEITELIKKYKPQQAALEKLFFARNTSTALMVAEARGVISLALQQNQTPYQEFTPLQIKQALTNYGQAPKTQVQQRVTNLLQLPSIPEPDDVADALAIAICASFKPLNLNIADTPTINA